MSEKVTEILPTGFLDRLPPELLGKIDYILKNQNYYKTLSKELQQYIVAELPYPDVLKMRVVHPEIVDDDFFWKIKTQRDFGAENVEPSRDFKDASGLIRKAQNWREEYLSYGQTLAPQLVNAVETHNVKKVEELLDLGVNPNAPGRLKTGHYAGWLSIPLVEASRQAYPDIVEMLLDAGADPNKRGPIAAATPLFVAATPFPSLTPNHIKIVEMLLEAGADPTIPTTAGHTPLHSTAYPEIRRMFRSHRI